jgi:tetratricopeptide (TPR) repeat protein
MNQILNKYRSESCLRYFRLILFFSFFLFDIVGVQAGSLDSLLNVALKENDPKKHNDKYLFYINKLSSTQRDSATNLLMAYEEECKKTEFEYGMARSMGLRAWFKNYVGKYEEGLMLLRNVESIQKRIGDSSGLANTFNRIGLVSLRFKRYKDSERYLTLSANYFLRLGDTTKIDMCYNNLGVLYSESKNHQKAIVYFKKTAILREIQKSYYWLGYAYYNIAESFLAFNSFDSAGYYFDLSLKMFIEKTPDGLVPPMVEVGVGSFYFKIGKYNEAEFHVKKGIERAKEIDHKEVLLTGYDLLGQVYGGLKNYELGYKAQIEFIDLKLYLDSINNFEQITEAEEKYKSAEKEVEIERLKSAKLEADGKAQHFLFYSIALLFVLILSAALIWIFWQKRNQSDKIKRAELNAKIAEAKMFALKAQMNPHFVFNCINTAQNFVLNNKKERAYEYLSDFAKLMRLVMENSSKLYIPVEDELQQIRLYIELESIRFEKRFGYRIFVDPELENGVYEIPGMILQPLIENAIGHGLINRQEDGGELILQLSLSGEKVLCELTDNGVGRKKALEIKAKKTIHYSSAAIPNIKERLIMLDGQYKLEIIDLVEKGIGVGTKVILELPYR